MSMEARYCPYCGQDHHAGEREAERAEAEAVDRDVEIERLRTKRDIEVARINAGAARDIAETEADHDVAHAEGVVAGVDAALEAVTGGDGDNDSGEAEPVIIDASEADAGDDDGDGAEELPKTEERDDSEREREPRPKPRKHGFF